MKIKKCICCGNQIDSESEYFVSGAKEQILCSVDCFSRVPPLKFLIKRNKNDKRVPLNDLEQAHLTMNWLNPFDL